MPLSPKDFAGAIGMIFLDMDGPLANFDLGFQDRFGVHPDRYKENKKAMWELVHSVPDFFEKLPITRGAREFYDWLIYDYQEIPAVLTACPHSAYHEVAAAKMRWMRNNLGPYWPLTLPSYGSEGKPAFIQNPGDILIDDWSKNCIAWEAAGGIAIKWDNNWEEVKEMLHEHRRLAA